MRIRAEVEVEVEIETTVVVCNVPSFDNNRRTTQYCLFWGFATLKVLSLVWTYRLLGPALNGFTISIAHPPCVEPWTFKSIEFYT